MPRSSKIICLVDADLVAYRSAASCEPTKAKPYQEPLEIAVLRCNDTMQRILDETGASEYKAFLSGPDNFRYGIDPNYKANRRDVPRPEWLEPIRELLVVKWGAHISDGVEADDNLGIGQTDSTVICSLDKDLLQVPGRHYNWVRQEWSNIDVHQGWVNFYTQLVMGDRADWICGFDGLMRQVVPKKLQWAMDALSSSSTPREMYKIVYGMYENGVGIDRMHLNAQLLYILRKEDDRWQLPEM